MGTKYVETLCDVCGAQGLQRATIVMLVGGVMFAHPRLPLLWWRDVCPPYIATVATFATFVGVTRPLQRY